MSSAPFFHTYNGKRKRIGKIEKGYLIRYISSRLHFNKMFGGYALPLSVIPRLEKALVDKIFIYEKDKDKAYIAPLSLYRKVGIERSIPNGDNIVILPLKYFNKIK